MEIKIQIKRLTELTKAFGLAPDAVKRQMRLALRVAIRDIQRRARSEHRFRSRSGNAERSITAQVVNDWPPVGRVALDPAVTMTNSGRSYAAMLHDGTRDHFIKPTKKKSLRWVGSDGEFWFSRGHHVKGIKADPFVYNAANNERANINATFNRYTERALREVGL